MEKLYHFGVENATIKNFFVIQNLKTDVDQKSFNSKIYFVLIPSKKY